MKTNSKILAGILLLTAILTSNGQSLERLKFFQMSIFGSSTLHEWESKVSKAELGSIKIMTASENLTIEKAELKILVHDIQSEHGKIMDSKTYEAFNADVNPTISFSLKNYTPSGSQSNVDGSLTMNGTTKPIKMIVDTKILPNGDVQFKGSYKLKMTDYKMEPPTAMMGTIKVGNDVTIKFDLTIGK